jgi:hypothetical protein
MPTITQLPFTSQVTAADSLPISQSGVTHSVTVGTLLASMQPAVMAESRTLLGRISLGAGGPESIAVGSGLVLSGGTLAASGTDLVTFPQTTTLIPTDQVVVEGGGNPKLLPLSLLRGLFSPGANISIDATGTISANISVGGGGTSGQSGSYSITALSSVPSIGATDLIAISQSGGDHTITYQNLLDGLTIDLAQPAVPASDTDTFWVAQGSSTMLRQTFAAIWSWLTPKLPSYKMPVVELTTNTTLDGTIHNGRILICSQPITLSPASLNMGSGFHCDVINLSSGIVTFASGITTSSGVPTLLNGQSASLRVASYSGGTIIFATTAGGASGGPAPAVPGQVINLVTSNPTANGVSLSWSAPTSGGAVSSYTIQYRVSGTTTWSTYATGITTTNSTVSGLSSSTGYDFQVLAVNSGGAGQPSSVATGTTTAIAGAVTGVTWGMVPSGSYTHGSGSIGVNAHITPATAAVQFGFSTSAVTPPSSWVVATHVNTDLWGAYVSTPATAGTWYAWVEGTDSSDPTVYPTPFTVT